MKKLLLLSFFFVLPAPAYSGGLVGDVAMPEGIEERPNITIKLIPPTSANIPERITTTDELGNYEFEQVEKGPYLMELHQGNELIRREVIEINGIDRKSIRLESRF